ncbi:MAG: hypothetical protein J3K34DRAFT_401964 [Monoraphidium minutum]|nr:MAG: hypothetical protein J3K34DRAFT_401964 [Monoraphidium minutum]
MVSMSGTRAGGARCGCAPPAAILFPGRCIKCPAALPARKLAPSAGGRPPAAAVRSQGRRADRAGMRQRAGRERQNPPPSSERRGGVAHTLAPARGAATEHVVSCGSAAFEGCGWCVEGAAPAKARAGVLLPRRAAPPPCTPEPRAPSRVRQGKRARAQGRGCWGGAGRAAPRWPRLLVVLFGARPRGRLSTTCPFLI